MLKRPLTLNTMELLKTNSKCDIYIHFGAWGSFVNCNKALFHRSPYYVWDDYIPEDVH